MLVVAAQGGAYECAITPHLLSGRVLRGGKQVLRSLIAGWQFTRPCRTCGAGARHPSVQAAANVIRFAERVIAPATFLRVRCQTQSAILSN
jgi:hypothetical protein